MKLRNKSTGEIGVPRVDYQELYVDTENGYTYNYKSLQNMCEEWEDYEESKGIQCIYYVNHFDAAKIDGVIVGFNSKEEAEKAVEKLKAWKRLKDKGFRFNCWYGGSKDMSFSIPQEIIDKTTAKDLDSLFGGEE